MKKNKTIILILSFVFIIIVFSIIFVFFRFNKDFKEIKELSSTVFEYSKQSDQINNLKTNSEKFKEDITKINSYLVGEEEEVNFIEKVESLANQQNLSINIISVDIDKDKVLYKEGLEYLVLNFKTRGGFLSTVKFLALLENMSYHISIEKTGLFYVEDKDNTKIISSGWEGVFNIKVLKKIK